MRKENNLGAYPVKMRRMRQLGRAVSRTAVRRVYDYDRHLIEQNTRILKPGTGIERLAARIAGHLVRPDIIVDVPGPKGPNIAVAEVKGWRSQGSGKDDIHKLYRLEFNLNPGEHSWVWCLQGKIYHL